MIQRIQSIYLLLAALVSGGQFAIPYAAAAPGSAEPVFADGVFNYQDNIGILISLVILTAVSLIAIFLFKNRNLQSKIVWTDFIVAFALFGQVIYNFIKLSQETAASTSPVSAQSGIGFPVIALVFLWLAQRAIRKDEQIVRSVDRLR